MDPNCWSPPIIMEPKREAEIFTDSNTAMVDEFNPHPWPLRGVQFFFSDPGLAASKDGRNKSASGSKERCKKNSVVKPVLLFITALSTGVMISGIWLMYFLMYFTARPHGMWAGLTGAALYAVGFFCGVYWGIVLSVAIMRPDTCFLLIP